MKAVFAVLLSYVLFSSECYAIKGGPIYGGGGGTTIASITGSYAGVLEPVDVTSSNSLGIFTAVIPETGLASGEFLMFTAGRTFLGPLQGIADPNKSLLRAIVQGIPVVTTGDTTITTLGLHADGFLNADITHSNNAVFSISSNLLVGTATITVTTGGQPGPDMEFVVDGFQQSTSTTSG